MVNLMEAAVGSSIKGSKFVRGFCAECDEAIRIPKSRVGMINYCSKHIREGTHLPEGILFSVERVGNLVRITPVSA